jgi:hypothetical protein
MGQVYRRSECIPGSSVSISQVYCRAECIHPTPPLPTVVGAVGPGPSPGTGQGEHLNTGIHPLHLRHTHLQAANQVDEEGLDGPPDPHAGGLRLGPGAQCLVLGPGARPANLDSEFVPLIPTAGLAGTEQLSKAESLRLVAPPAAPPLLRK